MYSIISLHGDGTEVFVKLIRQRWLHGNAVSTLLRSVWQRLYSSRELVAGYYEACRE